MKWVALAVVLLFPSSAAAQARFASGAPAPRYNAWVARSLAPTVDVTVHQSQDVSRFCGVGASGCELGGDIWVATGPDTRYLFLHEMGHAFEEATLNDRQRRRFQHIDGSADLDWRGGDYTARPSEHFAIAYAACAMAGKSAPVEAGMVSVESVGYLGDASAYRQTCRLIDVASRGTGLLDYTAKS